MPVGERDYMKEGEPPAPVGPKAWLERLNRFGERHARLIITVSTALIIVTVLIFAKIYYDKARIERARLALAEADSIEKLVELRDKYGSTPVMPRILFRLANRYYEENKLEEAKKEYEAFKESFSDHALFPDVERAMQSLERDLTFERTEKAHLLRPNLLQTHPRFLPEMDDPRLQWAPLPRPRPRAEITLGTGTVMVTLYADEAPEAVAAFLRLAGEKAFDGLDVRKAGEARLRVAPAKESAIPFEATALEPVEGSLVMIRKEGKNVTGGFEILLKAAPDLKDVTVFGKVEEGLPILRSLGEESSIASVKVTQNR